MGALQKLYRQPILTGKALMPVQYQRGADLPAERFGGLENSLLILNAT